MTERPARKLRAGSGIGMEFVVAGGGAAAVHVMRPAREVKRKERNAQDAIGYKLTSEARGESGRCYESWLPNGEKRWPAKRLRRGGLRSGEKNHEKRRESVGL